MSKTADAIKAYLAEVVDTTVMSYAGELIDEDTAKQIALGVRDAVISGIPREKPGEPIPELVELAERIKREDRGE